MARRRYSTRINAGFVLSLILFALTLAACTPPDATTDDLSELTSIELTDEKLREDIRALRNERSWQARILALVPIGTLVGGLAGAAIAYVRFRHDRLADAKRRVDERFSHVAANLGSESEVVRNGAAVSLRTFLRPRYGEDVFRDAFDLVMANLKIDDHPESVRRILADTFADGVSRWQLEEEDAGFNLARAWLKRVNLEGMDLRRADLARAELQGAILRDCDLRGTRGYNVFLAKAVLSGANMHNVRWQHAQAPAAYFHNARMVGIDLKHADLSGAKFQNAELQAALLQNAKLIDADFTQAKLSDAHFEGATLNPAAAQSILRAVGWREAHFAEDAKALLREVGNQ